MPLSCIVAKSYDALLLLSCLWYYVHSYNRVYVIFLLYCLCILYLLKYVLLLYSLTTTCSILLSSSSSVAVVEAVTVATTTPQLLALAVLQPTYSGTDLYSYSLLHMHYVADGFALLLAVDSS